ncbi:MAG: YihY/virulence factor BrkB family protein [Alkalispirochaeta sp.]
MNALRAVLRRYIQIHGPLLAKGLSFSSLFAAVPLLFLLTLAGSIYLTPEVRGIIEGQFLSMLPEGYRIALNTSLDRFAGTPGSLSIATIAVFLVSVHILFFDVHRVVRAGLGIPVSPARGQIRALLLTAGFLILIYATALITLVAELGSERIPLPPVVITGVARGSAVIVLSATIGSIIRLAAGRAIPFRVGAPVFLVAALLWQGAGYLSGFIVRGMGRRLLVYGVLASAVLFLFLMRIFSEIILHAALWIHYLQEPRHTPAPQEPLLPRHSHSDRARRSHSDEGS